MACEAASRTPSSWPGALAMPYVSSPVPSRFEIMATHGRPNGDELGFHGCLLGAVDVFQHKRLAYPQDLAINLVNVLAAVVLDPEVLADREQLAAQLVSGPAVD